MEKWRLKMVFFLVWVSLACEKFELCACLSGKGRDLLRSEESVKVDSLLSWKAGSLNPCSLFGVDCSVDLRVWALNAGRAPTRRLLRDLAEHSHHRKRKSNSANAPSPSPSPAPAPSRVINPVPSPPPTNDRSLSPPENPSVLRTSDSDKVATNEKKSVHAWIIYTSVGGALCFLGALSAVYLLCLRGKNVDTVMPWSTGLSGQLQKAFVTGVPSLRRSELETACEQFSNIVGTLSDCTLYKGTLSSGVEIAVTSTLSRSALEWSDKSQAHFRKKISVLSKVNHKNFMNLLGYCEEEAPFTRMMVFEYAPNGTLFEHLHIKEAEQLEWATRLRIAMGVIYCLEHMHQLDLPVIVKNLNSSSIYLTEDYAAKVSDIGFWNEDKEAEADSECLGQESIVYKYGILLLEVISGRLPFSEDDGLLVLWASSYLNGTRPLDKMVDPTLKSVPEKDISALSDVVRSCIKADPKERPSVAEVAAQMREITSILPDAATPKDSPLWWAELEIVSSPSC
ncbi:inactive receptor-like serine/threonine-protein kinase At2g40270 [Ananas comosus]|uniref:Inactive receptor-like serine/threonine-protein kinase At2g40270 n=1 Tax=Ananas comosus TaxID=4615 RepID=A0A6P5G8L6_ANACO|nr:inactive receptor-like serine/threonine-protein kinase At2g40270 [Ananas comosus]